MTNRNFRFLSVIVGLGFLSLAAARAELRIAGTDLLGVDFSKALYEYAQRNDLELTIAFDGSRQGLDRLKEGRADLVLFSLPPNEPAALTGCLTAPLAFHRVIVLVSPALPLKRVSLDQLDGIFGEGSPANNTHWGDLGLEGDLAGRAISPHVPADGVGIAAEFFRRAALSGREFKPNVRRYTSPLDLARLLSGESRVIVLAVAAPYSAEMARLVPVAVRVGDPAYLPTAENLRSGDYPLQLPLCVAFRRESARTLQPLLAFLFGNGIAPRLESAGLVPLPSAARQRQLAEWEKL